MQTATMDFFASQDAARRKTGLLVAYYLLAVLLIMVAVYLAVAGTFLGVETRTAGKINWEHLWNPTLFAGSMGVTLLIVVLGSAYKISTLSGGGESVATLLGGRPVSSNTSDRDERRLVNVVEEMAIASGTPVPRVFMMDGEGGINAFAAGFSATDAVIGVTSGCVKTLTRDELQGVIGHEFSHILNGDMRLNIRLMGVLHGILIIGLIGYWLFRTSLYAPRSRSSDSKGKIPILVLGLALMAIGFIGVFFGKLIKSAISRQREFLADASAVQFTRSPLGIAGALKKIGGFKKGSRLSSTHAEEASHFFFANGLSGLLSGLMATHPPLRERIDRIEGGADELVRAGGDAGPQGDGGGMAGEQVSGFAVRPETVIESIGTVRPEHLSYVSGVIASLPTEVVSSAHEPFGARAVVYCLLLNSDETVREAQLRRLEEHADTAAFGETCRIMPHMDAIGAQCRLPLVDIAISSLKGMSERQFVSFVENVNHLVAADDRVDLFEYTLQRMILRHLEPSIREVKRPSVRYKSIKPLLSNCVLLLSSLAHWGNKDPIEAQRAFAKGAKKLSVGMLSLAEPQNCSLKMVNDALDELVCAAPTIKKRVLDACASCVAADGTVTIVESELLRAVADSLDCPIPPILADQ